MVLVTNIGSRWALLLNVERVFRQLWMVTNVGRLKSQRSGSATLKSIRSRTQNDTEKGATSRSKSGME